MKPSLVAFFASFAQSFLIYAILRQDCFYRHDGWGFVSAIEQAQPFSSAHAFYLPLARLWSALLAPLGLDSFVATGLFSALGTALAVAIQVLSLRRLGHRDGILAAAWVGLCPAVLFFSTVVEVHGVFLALASLSFYLCVRLCEEPGWLLAALLGASMALATGMHASGVLLPLLFLPWYGRRARSAWTLTLSRILLAGGVAWILPVLFLPGTVGSTASVLESLRGLVAQLHRLLPVVWTEWLWPFFPTSFLILAALFSKKQRLDALLLLLLLLPYLLVCTLLLQEEAEIGAYLLPWIFPASILCLDLLESRRESSRESEPQPEPQPEPPPEPSRGSLQGLPWSRVLVLMGALLGLWNIASHERERGVDRTWAKAVALTHGETPSFVLVWEDWEMDSLLLTSKQDHIQPLYMPPYAAYAPEMQKNLLPAYGALFGTRKSVLLTAATRRGLADPEASLSGPMILAWLEKNLPLVLLDERGQRR